MLQSIATEHKSRPITAVFIQEHQLHKRDRLRHIQRARAKQMLLIISYGPIQNKRARNGRNTQVAYGGTAIIIPHSSLDRGQNESLDAARDRVSATMRRYSYGRTTTVKMKVEDVPLKLISAYAPADGARGIDRPNYFKHLKTALTRNSALGIDANCVHDTHLDLQRTATSPYSNSGIKELEDALESAHLRDVAREQLGTRQYFTSDHVVTGGQHCKARLDRIYTPNCADMAWTFSICDDFFPLGIVRR